MTMMTGPYVARHRPPAVSNVVEVTRRGTTDAPERGANDRLGAVAVIAGPVVFVTTWVVAGGRYDGYTPTVDPISELAAVGAPTRVLMTAGFVAYGAFVLAAAPSLGRRFGRSTGIAAALNAVATFAVAALPLGSPTTEDLHGVAAGAAYVALVAIPLTAIRRLRREGSGRWVIGSALVAGVATVALASSVIGDSAGLAQRIGLSTVDGWLIAAGIALLVRGSVGVRAAEPRP